MNVIKSRRVRDLASVLVPVVFCLAVLAGPAYWVQLAIGVVITVILGLSWDVLGRGGLVSFGQAAFFGIGAYASAILGSHMALLPAWLLALLICGIVAAALGYVTIRLSGIYFSIATLGFTLCMQVVVIAAKPLTGGPGGIAPPLVGEGDPRIQLIVAALCLLVALIVSWALLTQRIRPAIFMLRGDKGLAAVSGVPVVRTRSGLFAVSGMLAGLAGALYGSLYGYIVPTDVFTLTFSTVAVATAVLGGTDRIAGAVLGGVVLRIIETGAQDVVGGSGYAAVYGAIIIVVVLVAPGGLWGLGEDLARRLGAGRGKDRNGHSGTGQSHGALRRPDGAGQRVSQS